MQKLKEPIERMKDAKKYGLLKSFFDEASPDIFFYDNVLATVQILSTWDVQEIRGQTCFQGLFRILRMYTLRKTIS